MKKVYFTLAFIFMASCGKETYRELNKGKAGSNCTSTKTSKGSLITCDDGTQVEIEDGANGGPGLSGDNGLNGSNGTDGTNGHNSLINIISSSSCAYSGVTILVGLDANDNDNLDASEVTSAKDVCNGEPARKPGVSCNLHNVATWDASTSLPQVLANNAPVGSFVLPNFNVPDSPSAAGFPGMPANLQAIVGLEGYALDCSGYIYIATSGSHSFSLLSDDGSRLVIEDNIIISNQGLHAPTLVSVSSVNLNRGWNKINVVYYQGPHTQVALQLKMTGPNSANQVVPTGLLNY